MKFHQYPIQVRRVVTALWFALLAINLAEYILQWARALYAWLYNPLHLPHLDFLQPFQNVLPNLLVAHLGLFAALIAARFLAFLTPSVLLQHKGLALRTRLGTRLIPYSAVRAIRSTELANGRYIVWVSATVALPLQDALASLLFGRWLWRGFLLTSDLDGFDEIVGVLAGQLKKRIGEEKFARQFVEEAPTRLLAMLATPAETLRALVAEETLPITAREAAWHIGSYAASMLLPLGVSALIHWQIPWGALLVPLIAALEVPLGALYLTAMPLESERRIEFRDAWRVYAVTQLPRWFVAFGVTWLIIAGVPFPILILGVVPALIPGCYAVIKLTEVWFEVKPLESLIGVIVSAIYQIVVYELFLVLLAR